MMNFKVLLVGDSSVGKSCILEYLTYSRFAGVIPSTIGVDFRQKIMQVDGQDIKLLIWDSGQERFRCLTPSFYRGADVIIFVYDVTNEESFLNIKKWIDEAETYVTKPDYIKLLVGNKIDLPHPVVSREKGMKFSIENKVLFMESSALSGVGIKLMFEQITEKVLSKSELGTDTRHSKMLTEKKKNKCCTNL